MAGKMSSLMAQINAAKGSKGGDNDDKKFYYPARDKAGNGSATIRFLSAPINEEAPFVKTFSHGFEGPGGWFIENCPTTIGQDCHCCTENGKLYKTLSKEEARKRGMNRKTSYIANIVVVSDKSNPENEGQVFQYKFGTKIWDKIVDALSPVDPDDKKFNVFNVDTEVEGNEEFANLNWPDFKLRIRKVDNQTNYDKSTFETSDTDVKVDMSKAESLAQYIAVERFKSPEELEKRFNKAVGNTLRVARVQERDDDSAPAPRAAQAPRPSPAKAVDAGEDDVEALMRKLAAESGNPDDDIPF
jgi:hypothetical protein